MPMALGDSFYLHGWTKILKSTENALSNMYSLWAKSDQVLPARTKCSWWLFFNTEIVFPRRFVKVYFYGCHPVHPYLGASGDEPRCFGLRNAVLMEMGIAKCILEEPLIPRKTAKTFCLSSSSCYLFPTAFLEYLQFICSPLIYVIFKCFRVKHCCFLLCVLP